MASMASIATQFRPRFVAALLLTVAVLPWHTHPSTPRPAETRQAATSLPLFIEVPAPIAVDVLVPPPMADAAEWPRGMVIRPPAIDGGILLWKDSPLDSILSAFLAPFRALGA
jgi:hypothetical protein